MTEPPHQPLPECPGRLTEHGESGEHDWRVDWYGDDTVPGGSRAFRVCRICGEEEL